MDPEQDPRKGLPVLGAPMPGPAAAPGGAGGAPGAVQGSAAPAPAAPAAHGGTGYVNLERYVGANQAGAQGMANAIGGDVAHQGQQTQADAAQLAGEMAHSTAAAAGAVDPALQAKVGAEAQQATMGAQALQSPGGIGALLTQHYGTGGGYGSGMRGFDSFLTGNAGGNQFQQLGNQYGGLDKYVSGLGASYTPQVASPGGIHGGPAGKSPPGMVGSFTPPAGPPPGPAAPQGGGPGPDERRKRRAV